MDSSGCARIHACASLCAYWVAVHGDHAARRADVLVFPRNHCLPEHPAERLWEEQFVCLVWNGSKHAGKPLSLQDYLGAGELMQRAVRQMDERPLHQGDGEA